MTTGTPLLEAEGIARQRKERDGLWQKVGVERIEAAMKETRAGQPALPFDIAALRFGRQYMLRTLGQAGCFTQLDLGVKGMI